MPIEVVVALLGAIAVGGADMMSRLNARWVSPLFMTAAVSAIGFVALNVAHALLSETPWHMPATQGLILLGAGVLNTLGLLALYSGMARGLVGIVSPVAAASPALVALMWMLAGVYPNAGAQMGLAITCASLILLGIFSQHRSVVAEPAAVRFALLMGATTAIALSVRMFVIQQTLSQVAVLDALIVVRFSGTLTAIVLLLLLHKRLPKLAAIREGSFSWRTCGWLLLQGLPETAGVLGVFWASSHGAFRAIAPALFSCSTLVTIVLARILIGEKMPLRARFAALGVVLGATCMTVFSA